jgi:hypothetical protein
MGRVMCLPFAAVRQGLAFVAILALPLTVGAHGTPAGVSAGYILVSHGLAVPDAPVIVDSPRMAATRSVTSNGQGAYSAPTFMPSLYNLTVEANGFKTTHLNGVVAGAVQLLRAGGTSM